MINQKIGAKRTFTGQYTIECDKVPDLPDISFIFGGRNYTLKRERYIKLQLTEE
jgi:saccharopepsin